MKNRVILLLLLFYNCDALTVNPPPEVLLTEETMENIIHDQLLLRTMQNSRLVKQDSLNVFNEDYILRKYSIQDTILAQNLEYYAQYPRRMSAIYSRIESRFNSMLDSLEQRAKAESSKKNKD